MKRNRSAAGCLASLLLLSACAHRPVNPDAVFIAGGLIVDGKGRDRAAIQHDGNECVGIANATQPEAKAAEGAVAGAVAGALLGALIFRGSGLSGNRGAAYGAGAGALGGASGGAAAGGHDFRVVLRNCMIGRGHVPLN
jgi:outer membrane lipoprotein SlyB